MTSMASAVIPARLESYRFPGKVLADLDGRSVLWHVWNRVGQAKCFGEVFVATDSTRIRDEAQAWGAQVLMTDGSPRNGTERVAAVVEQVGGELIVNVPADEPLIDPALLDEIFHAWCSDPCDLITAGYPIKDPARLWDPTVVKIVRSHSGEGIYFSRSAVPAVRDAPMTAWPETHAYWGHLGVYGYDRKALLRYPSLPPSALEVAEGLEQLRFLEAGCRVRVVDTECTPSGVNTPSDLDRVRELLARA